VRYDKEINEDRDQEVAACGVPNTLSPSRASHASGDHTIKGHEGSPDGRINASMHQQCCITRTTVNVRGMEPLQRGFLQVSNFIRDTSSSYIKKRKGREVLHASYSQFFRYRS